MKKIVLSQDDYEFLKDLQNELNTQTTDGNAQPVFWGVMEKKEVAVPEGCGDDIKISYDDGAWDLNEAIDAVNECISEYPIELRERWGEIDKTDIQEIFDFMKDELEWDNIYNVYDVKEEDVLCRYTGAFLTKRAAKEYVEKYAYNHNKPFTYAMTAFRNFELERLLNILRKIEFKDE